MRILSVSDLHYRLPHYDWLVKAAADADVVVLAGDLADVVSPVPHEVQAVVLTTYLSRLAEHALVLASSGNHDLDGPGRQRRAGGRLAAAASPTTAWSSTARPSTSTASGSPCAPGGTAR